MFPVIGCQTLRKFKFVNSELSYQNADSRKSESDLQKETPERGFKPPCRSGIAKVLLNPSPTFTGRTSALPVILSWHKIMKKNRIDNGCSKKNAVLMAYLDKSKQKWHWVYHYSQCRTTFYQIQT